MSKEDCLFCKIVAGELPSTRVYEDRHVLAFEDINPQMLVHTVIVTKNHYDSIADEIPEEELGWLFGAVRKVAQIEGVDETGFRVIVNAGPDGRQSVDHVHVHVLGGARMNSGNPLLPEEETPEE